MFDFLDELFETAIKILDMLEYCKVCKEITIHNDLPVHSFDNPYESEWVCMACEERNRLEHEKRMTEFQAEYERLQAAGCGDAAESAWERINGF